MAATQFLRWAAIRHLTGARLVAGKRSWTKGKLGTPEYTSKKEPFIATMSWREAKRVFGSGHGPMGVQKVRLRAIGTPPDEFVCIGSFGRNHVVFSSVSGKMFFRISVAGFNLETSLRALWAHL
jgi:hypothetical protein